MNFNTFSNIQFDTSIKSQYEGQALNKPVLSIHRVQDAPLQEMGDKGVCLSMHQPWASLLTGGIKLYAI